MGYSVAGILLLFLCVGPSIARELCPESVIKDAILSLAHIMRENSQKLDRHEARERVLGEWTKKAVGSLSKKMSIIDTSKTHLTKIEDSIASIQQLISQRDERERIQIQKTADMIENLEHRLDAQLDDIKNTIFQISKKLEPSPPPPTPEPTVPPTTPEPVSPLEILSKLNETEARLLEQVAKIENELGSMALANQQEALRLGHKTETVFTEVQNISNRLGDVEIILEQIQSNDAKNETEKKSEEPTVNITTILEEQGKALGNVRELMEDTANRIQDIPTLSEAQALHNETQAALQETKHALEEIIDLGFSGMTTRANENKEEIKESIGTLRSDLADNAERVNGKLSDITKSQIVMVTTADTVLDTRKRVEYGLHQILLEIGELVKDQSLTINKTLNMKFEGISNDIMGNQTKALTGLTNKMEQELNQVWRQINVMYQQMTESAKSLERLHDQNEAYVNGSTSTMDGMGSKVSDITERMHEVDSNLNFLLGRLSLVTQEFNQIKSGLGAALDNIKASFKEVQKKANDLSNPGPYAVPDDHVELEPPSYAPDTTPDITNSIFDLTAN
ncbi:centrosomal protein of 290 kDa [Athalia rosae]|uniref:centrosomal protein of 290 kDa n=1 Tax=Athalia rosae TaxID=37344 RepID=UPI002033E615|nr:centrosomal protein of 290 kDa [Athalia rosae]XP_012257573.2 centrosomal protein of 290 kDa [Athalia rosae]